MELFLSKSWRLGPGWLTNPEPTESTFEESMPDECATEMKSPSNQATSALLATIEQSGVHQIINCKEFSSITKLLRVTGYVMKFVHILKQKVQRDGSQPTELTPGDLGSVLTLWTRESQ